MTLTILWPQPIFDSGKRDFKTMSYTLKMQSELNHCQLHQSLVDFSLDLFRGYTYNKNGKHNLQMKKKKEFLPIQKGDDSCRKILSKCLNSFGKVEKNLICLVRVSVYISGELVIPFVGFSAISKERQLCDFLSQILYPI